ncbi:hypothetical protein OZX72_04850 [Bifidobacterium sp. ESL0769]|uniref:hypothetical protein n=1 Tax=Bifidobacterium sp. ESL0769 TaxID=2983229 RepID=UPI0023F6685C|nr:hypothetical protein [Bifidobacterium sp. ESL0769]WEV68301.1 hypothetical protein OZX72_04850 [Bifidobacterium sp. ESL0769]
MSQTESHESMRELWTETKKAWQDFCDILKNQISSLIENRHKVPWLWHHKKEIKTVWKNINTARQDGKNFWFCIKVCLAIIFMGILSCLTLLFIPILNKEAHQWLNFGLQETWIMNSVGLGIFIGFCEIIIQSVNLLFILIAVVAYAIYIVAAGVYVPRIFIKAFRTIPYVGTLISIVLSLVNLFCLWRFNYVLKLYQLILFIFGYSNTNVEISPLIINIFSKFCSLLFLTSVIIDWIIRLNVLLKYADSPQWGAPIQESDVFPQNNLKTEVKNRADQWRDLLHKKGESKPKKKTKKRKKKTKTNRARKNKRKRK